MKSFRQYISEAGIRRKLRKKEGIRKKLYRGEIAARENKPGAPTEEQLDAMWQESDAADRAVEQEQERRHPRIVKKAVELAEPGESPEEHLKNASSVASDMVDAEIPSPLKHWAKKTKDTQAVLNKLIKRKG